jgi:hypothetical protein
VQLFSIGDVRVSALIEREGPQRKTAELFPTADRELALRHFRDMEPFLYQPASDRIYNTYQSFQLRIPGRTVLIDTCVGENKARPPQFAAYPKKPWLDACAAEGLSFEDIDLEICTHLHVDHVGWNTRLIDGRWEPTYPNPKYIFGRVECEYWEARVDEGYDLPGRIWTDSCLPLIRSGRAELVEMDADLGGGLSCGRRRDTRRACSVWSSAATAGNASCSLPTSCIIRSNAGSRAGAPASASIRSRPLRRVVSCSRRLPAPM